MSSADDVTNNTRVRLRLRGLDYDSVLNWSERPKRTRRPPPPTYWEEFVETDEWYLRELVSDVPADELHAALEDENWEHDNSDVMEDGEEDEEDGANSDASGEGDGEESDSTFVPSDADADDDDVSSTTSATDDDTTPGTDDDETQHDDDHTRRDTLHVALHFSDDDD